MSSTVNLTHLLCVAVVILVTSDVTSASGIFKIPNIPACFTSYSQYQYTSLYNLCSATGGGLNYLYCSTDHTCGTVNGYPACFTARTQLNGAEITGIVIGCVVFVILMIGLTVFISVKCCSKGCRCPQVDLSGVKAFFQISKN